MRGGDGEGGTGKAGRVITHGLGEVAEMGDRVVVRYAGSKVEEGTAAEIFDAPTHPYTRGLLDSMPDLDDEAADLNPIPGQVPDPAALPSGCALSARRPRRPTPCPAVCPRPLPHVPHPPPPRPRALPAP